MLVERSLLIRLAPIALIAAAPVAEVEAQPPAIALGDGPWRYTTFERQTEITVSIVNPELDRPWARAFLPGTADADNPMGDALITRSGGSIRLLRDGRLEPESVADLSALALDQLFDITLHPRFETNVLVHVTCLERAPRPGGSDGCRATSAVARGRLERNRLHGVGETVAAEAWRQTPGGNVIRVEFAPH